MSAPIRDFAAQKAVTRLEAEVKRLNVRLSSLVSEFFTLQPYSDAERPPASSVPKYTMIFNTTDNEPNVSDGTDWIDPTGAAT